MTEPIKLPSRDDLIRMAQEAGFHEWYSTPERDYHFGCVKKLATLAVEQHEVSIRRELALSYSHGLYTDDGELQDNTAKPFLDFKRDSFMVLGNSLRNRVEQATAEMRGKLEKAEAQTAAWVEKAKVWLASPEALQQLNGYQELANRAEKAEKSADNWAGIAQRTQAKLEKADVDREDAIARAECLERRHKHTLNTASSLCEQLGKATKERDEARAECLEQARLNGMGSEREARLMAQLNEVRRELAAKEKS